MKNTLERTSCQIDLEIELDVIQRNIRKVKNPVKKNRLTRAYEGLVDLLIASLRVQKNDSPYSPSFFVPFVCGGRGLTEP